jgi:hypothetical protein
MTREHKKHVAELDLIRARIKAVCGIIADIKPHKDVLVVAAAAGDNAAIKKLDQLRAAEAELADLIVVEPIAAAAVEADEQQARKAAEQIRGRQLIAERTRLPRRSLARLQRHRLRSRSLRALAPSFWALPRLASYRRMARWQWPKP